MAAVLQMGADQWDQQKQQMATATPVIRPGAKGKPVTVPDHPPPAGYVCYRCGEKGHWIQVCPTNDDPTFENRPRIKRTTGIPKSFLKSVEKPTKLDDGSSDDNKVPAGVMVNADGDWVIAEPDKASWEQYQAKASKSVAAQKEAALDSKEIHDRGLECPIDKRMFVEPSRTPCCQTTYCNECITNALLDGDLQCPNCGKEGILIDDLKPDDEMIKKIRSYEEEKAAEAKKKEVDEVSSEKDRTEDKKESVDETTREDARSNKSSSPEKSPSSSNSKLAPDSKKRKADTDLENDRKSPGVTVTLNQKEADKETTKDDEKPKTAAKPAQAAPKFPPELEFMNQAGMANGALMPNMAGFPNMPMNMPMNMGMPMGMDMNMNMNMMGMDPAMWNQMMMMQSGMSNQWNGMNGMNGMPVGMNGMPMQPTNGYYGGNQHMNMAGYGQPNGQMMHGNGNGYGRGRGGQFNNNFTHQQRHHNFSAPQPNNQESAYFRQPVNPHRHQSRRNVPRPTDYREI